MRYLKQFGIILFVSLVGEALNTLVPLPIPASVYGVVIMFLCLEFGIIKVNQIKETSAFLIEIMPLLFIPAAVGLIDCWDIMKSRLAAYIVVTVVTIITVMAVSGWITQAIIRGGRRHE